MLELAIIVTTIVFFFILDRYTAGLEHL
jgi:hypothetical protein